MEILASPILSLGKYLIYSITSSELAEGTLLVIIRSTTDDLGVKVVWYFRVTRRSGIGSFFPKPP